MLMTILAMGQVATDEVNDWESPGMIGHNSFSLLFAISLYIISFMKGPNIGPMLFLQPPNHNF